MIILWAALAIGIVVCAAVIALELLDLGKLDPELNERQAEENTKPHAKIRIVHPIDNDPRL